MSEKIEVWKSLDFLGYPDYEVSNWGRVKSLPRNTTKGGILKASDNGCGYLFVGLCKNNKVKNFKVHRLVALTFLENSLNLPQINHKNEIKTDNRVENLEWVSPKENINHGTRNERVSQANKIPILQFTKDMVFIREWNSATDIEKELHIHQGNICQCCKGNRKTCGGYIWRYKE